MHITITGNLGSGKSTICKLLNEKYNFEIYSTGKVQREIARQMNLTTLELNQLMRSDHKYDTMIDDATARISRENRDKNIIFDSRLAWHFVEQSFKVFMSVSLDEAAERVLKDNRGEEEKYTSVEEAKKMLAERAATEKIRYKEIYDLDYFDFSNYNLVIDSTYCLPEKIAEIIMLEAKAYERSASPSGKTKLLLSPKRLWTENIMSDSDKEQIRELVDQYNKVDTYIDTVVKVRKNDNDYLIEEGLNHIKAALLANVPYVPVEIINY